MALGERLKAPMVHAMRGKEHVEWENPYDVGMTGLIGFSSGYYAMLDCDVLLMLGTDFPYRQFYPQGPASASRRSTSGRRNIGRRAPVDLGIVGDVKATLGALLPLLEEKRDGAHLTQARQHYRRARKAWTTWPSAGRASGRSIRNRSPRRSATRRRPMRYSPAMSVCRRCGRRAIWR